MASLSLRLVKTAPGSCSAAVVFLHQVFLHSPAYFCSQAEDWDRACELPCLGTSHWAVTRIPWYMVHICLATC